MSKTLKSVNNTIRAKYLESGGEYMPHGEIIYIVAMDIFDKDSYSYAAPVYRDADSGVIFQIPEDHTVITEFYENKMIAGGDNGSICLVLDKKIEGNFCLIAENGIKLERNLNYEIVMGGKHRYQTVFTSGKEVSPEYLIPGNVFRIKKA